MVKMLPLFMPHLGYDNTVLVESADAAIKHLDTLKPDLLITDFGLVGGKDGFDVLAAAKAKYPDVPTVLFSGTHDIEHSLAPAGFGATGFIRKPFSMDAMKNAIAFAKEQVVNVAAKRAEEDVAVQAAPVAEPVSQPEADKKNPVIVFSVHDITAPPGVPDVTGDILRKYMVEFMAQRPYDISIQSTAAAALHEAELLQQEGRTVVVMSNARNNVTPEDLDKFAAAHPKVPVIINTGGGLTSEEVPNSIVLSQPFNISVLHGVLDDAVARAVDAQSPGKFAAKAQKSSSAMEMAANAPGPETLARK
jgi:DNA-binding NtrC family response regulator